MIEKFIDDYSERGFQFAYHLCGDVEQAKEIVQEAFFHVIRKMEQFDAGQSQENWFLTILRNVYLDGVRRQERRNTVSLDAALCLADEEGLSFADTLRDEGEEPLISRLERQELGLEVREAIESLKLEYRAIVTLSDIQGLGYGEIAAVLGCPKGSVKSRLSRARRALKRRLLERSGEIVT